MRAEEVDTRLLILKVSSARNVLERRYTLKHKSMNQQAVFRKHKQTTETNVLLHAQCARSLNKRD